MTTPVHDCSPAARRVWLLARRGMTREQIMESMGWRSVRSLQRRICELRERGHAIGCLRDPRGDRRRSDHRRELVARLRAAGWTWEQIGIELGVTRQRAHQIGRRDR